MDSPGATLFVSGQIPIELPSGKVFTGDIKRQAELALTHLKNIVLDADFSMDEVLDQYFKNLNVPVIKNFPAGHVRSNISLPLGVLAELDTEQGVLRFLESSTLNRDR